MKWPWVRRDLLEAAELRAVTAEQRAVAAEARAQAAEARLDAAEAERKLLTDRAFEMAGHPPVYERRPVPVAPAAPQPAQTTDGDSLPGPGTRLTFKDVHAAAQKAMQDGTFSLVKRA